MSAYFGIANLELLVDGYELEGLEQPVSSEFVRRTTVIHLLGAGEEGLGEDVIYDAEQQARFQAGGDAFAGGVAGQSPPTRPGRGLDLAGRHTIESFSALLEGMEDYRRWGFESAALDLALRQAGIALHEALGRKPRPVTFVVSTSIGEERVARLRQLPAMRFKLDPTSDWDEDLVAELAELDRVAVVDFKEAYTWRAAAKTPGADVYRLVVEALPAALIEDPGLSDPEKAAVLEPHRERITWDAVIHSVADVDALPFPPRTLNSKPSRFGSIKRLFDFYDTCAERGISLYGGGQFELGPGRGQIQYLASLFHPDASNDVAPAAYNQVPPPADLPGSPLPPTPDSIGFRWLQA